MPSRKVETLVYTRLGMFSLSPSLVIFISLTHINRFFVFCRAEAEAQVKGYSAPVFKKFGSAAQAASFVKSNSGSGRSSSTSLSSASGSKSYGGGSSYSDGGDRSSNYSDSSSYYSSNTTSSKHSDSSSSSSSSKPFTYTPSSSSSSKDRCVVYTDGSSRGNGKSSAQAGVGVFYGDNDPRNVSRPLSGPSQTNQRAELSAISDALSRALTDRPEELHIKTDSEYAINCNTTWGNKWEANGYTTANNSQVVNSDLIKESRGLIKKLEESGTKVTFEHVKAHTDVYGNNKADELANQGAFRR